MLQACYKTTLLAPLLIRSAFVRLSGRQGRGPFAASFAMFFMLHLPARHNKGVSLRSHNGDNGGTAAAAAIRLINNGILSL